MKKSFFLFFSILLFSCSTEEEAPEVIPEPEPTTFLEKYNNTAWENEDVGRIGFENDTSRFLWNIGLLECNYFSDNISFEEDGNTYSIQIERNIPEEFIYSISLTDGENTASYVRKMTVSNDVLTESIALTINGEIDGDPAEIQYNLLSNTLTSYCN